MSRHASRIARAAAAAALLCMPQLLRPAPARAQGIRQALSRVVAMATGQLETAVTERDAPASRPPSLRACGALYNQDVRKLAEGPELLRDYGSWIASSYQVITNSGGMPLPVCFEWKSYDVDTNFARTLLHVNNAFMQAELNRARPTTEAERQNWNGYELTGHADPAEPDTMLATLARGRAEAVQTQSNPGPTCRFVVLADPRATAQVFHRKVTYSYQPAVRNCHRPSR